MSATTASAIAEKYGPVETWQSQPLEVIYSNPVRGCYPHQAAPGRQCGQHRLARGPGRQSGWSAGRSGALDRHGGEGANFWLSVVTDLQHRGVEDVFTACIDGLTGFMDAILAVFPRTRIQKCAIQQIHHSRSPSPGRTARRLWLA